MTTVNEKNSEITALKNVAKEITYMQKVCKFNNEQILGKSNPPQCGLVELPKSCWPIGLWGCGFGFKCVIFEYVVVIIFIIPSVIIFMWMAQDPTDDKSMPVQVIGTAITWANVSSFSHRWFDTKGERNMFPVMTLSYFLKVYI